MVVQLRLIAFFLIFLVSCTGQARVSHVPPRALVVHADTEFTTEERNVIHTATDSLMSQVGMRVDIIYDLDFGKVEQLSRFHGLTLLIRTDRSSELTREMDTHFKGIVYGWTIGVVWIRAYIVSDVLSGGGETLYLHVVMHEILHIVGCEHVSDPNAVLYWQTDHLHKAVNLTEADRVELIRAGNTALTQSRGSSGQKH